MILVLGQIADPVLANVCARLAARRADLLLVHPNEEGERLDFSWSTDGDAHIREVVVGARRIHISQLTSVFVRGMASKQATTPKGQAMITATWELVDSLPVLVANRRTGSHSNMSKPYQQHLIAREGFMTPRTLITMQAEEAKAFYDVCDGRVIYKSISAERSIVKSLSKEDFPRLADLIHCPVQFQEFVPGIDYRVHTVGERVFASEVISDGKDYRYVERDGGARTMRAVELPADLEAQCVRLAKSLDLVWSGIDLRRTPDGTYYCFEVNTSPGFVFFENQTGQRIGDALADMLCAGRA